MSQPAQLLHVGDGDNDSRAATAFGCRFVRVAGEPESPTRRGGGTEEGAAEERKARPFALDRARCAVAEAVLGGEAHAPKGDEDHSAPETQGDVEDGVFVEKL